MARKVPLKTVEIELPGSDKPVPMDYGAQIITILKTPKGRGGMSMDEMLAVHSIIKRVERANAEGDDILILEDAQYDEVMSRLRAFQFSTHADGLVQFIKDLTGAETFDLAEAERPTPKAETKH